MNITNQIVTIICLELCLRELLINDEISEVSFIDL